MKRNLVTILFFIIFSFIQGGFLLGQHRDTPVDIIIALDKSKSMVEEIEAVKRYVNTEIVDKILQKDDFLLIITFFGKTVIPVSTFIQDEEHKKEIKRKVSRISANGRYTDIGNALDKIREEVKRQTKGDRKKTLLLITDGRHEPPASSKYFSKEGKLSHEYLKSTTETQKRGWKIIVLGIGTESAKELAYKLDANYKKTTDMLTARELAGITPSLIGRIKIKGRAKLSSINEKGEAVLRIALETKFYHKPQEVIINAIKIESDGLSQKNLLETPFKIELPAQGKIKLFIPVFFKERLETRKYKGRLIFSFSSKESFAARLPLYFRIKTDTQVCLWVIFIAIISIIVFFILFLLLKVFVIGKTIVFKLIVQEQPLKGKNIFKVRKGKQLYLNNDMDIIDIANKKTSKSITRLTATDAGLRMFILKKNRFPFLKNVVKNVLGESFIVKTEKDENYHVEFVSLKK